MSRTLSRIGRFLELRAKAFVYALCVLVGFQLGMMVHQRMALVAIAELGETTRHQIMEAAR